ncbi:MAG: hypothetical protein AAF393_13975 [Pseudomonadota bacterium]
MGRTFPIAIAMVAALAVGLWFALWTWPMDETDLINRFAAQYSRDTGNAATDCVARPADVAELKLYVICRPEAGAAQVYLVNHRGKRVNLPSLEAILKEEV